MATKKGVKLLISIVEHGQGKQLIRFYSNHGLNCHFQTVGHGTASSEVLDILGVGSTERDVIISFGENTKAQYVFWKMKEEDAFDLRARGIAFSMPLTALNTLAAAVLMRETEQKNEKGEVVMQQKMEDEHSMIMIVVNQGW